MMSTKHLITVADLDNYPDDDGNRYELIEGELLVSRAPGIPHQLVLFRLQGKFFQYLEENPIGRMVPGPGAVFSDFDAVIPDLVFVTNERWEQIVEGTRFVAAPDLVIEIVSPGRENRRRDVDLKRRLYGRYGVREYWIVDPEDQSVGVYELNGANLELVNVFKDDSKIHSAVLPHLSLTSSVIFKI
jgi:Uma2 family endonuclease